MPSSLLLDAAQGPLHPAARETLLAAVDAGWADPRRLYTEGRRARALLDQAREILANGLGVRPVELSLHPSGADALAVALEGLVHARRRHGRRLVAGAVEHSVVLRFGQARAARDPADALAVVPVDRHGAIVPAAWDAEMSAGDVAVACLQHANGEVGTLQPLAEAYAVARSAGVPLLCDAQASLGRVASPHTADVVVGSAASFAGPPSIGLLAVREGTRFALPGHRREAEHGRAESDPWVPLVLAAAEAWRQVEAERERESREASELVERLRHRVGLIEGVVVAGHPEKRLPHVLTASALYVDGETVVHALAREGLLVASGSACTASTLEPSHVLAAMGVLTQGNVRITLPLAAVAPERATAVDRFPAALAEALAAARAGLWPGSGPDDVKSSTATLDARGSLCPQPIIDLARWWRRNPDAPGVRLVADDEAARADVPAWCRMTGRELQEVRDLEEGGTAYLVGRGRPTDQESLEDD
ncbi:aminotransferase class V-fold PLP-dependent enzyme [Nostocoides sp. F2B08]|uniref:cysteine desulfurase/sulfurtransferase TusA family protein n=1 Tax=Nostocoides sp. F2B08 TaxID=2653936 RepID=UPI001263B3E3|nr:aminotransferase class V-fold PLP-dependent enzyme [Tetrasphaera sp. F2B08]KAB7742472.1 aminotransferase class V-fold PLP-dependent enzyme [Tetrasphaera sp. F2B08]